MIRLIYGIPGAGKTALAVALGIDQMYGENAIEALEIANAEVAELNERGFNVSPPRSDHLVYCSDNMSIDVTSPDFGHRRSLVLYPDRLGIAMEGFKPQYTYRGSTYIIDELADYVDARRWGKFTTGCCRFFAKHRKHGLTIIGTCQDPEQVEKRVRMLSTITQVRSIEFVTNGYSEVTQTVWELYNWDCYEDWEQHKEPTPETYIYNGDIREAYNTYEGEEEFYIGLDNADFSCEYSGYTDLSPEGIEEYGRRIALLTKVGDN